MTLPDDANAVRSAVPGGAAPAQRKGDRGVVGNERLTALTGAVLLALIVAELVTTASLHTLLSAHIFVGVLLAGPLILKLGSAGYRFLRYYTRSPAYVRKGPPRLALRVLAPLLVATTLLLIGSGIGLLVVGPGQEGLMMRLHAFSTLIWIPLLAIHAVAYFPRVPRLVADDWSASPSAWTPRRGIRLGVNLGALLGGVFAAILLLPVAAPWNTWIATNGNNGPAGPLVVGLILAVLAVVATTPLWRRARPESL